MSPAHALWRPTATLTRLQLRADLLARTRAFFAARQVLEVETPLCVRHAVTDVQLQSLAVSHAGEATARYLHTSAEYAMKRLLAAGSGDIYQLCHVFRGSERGPHHSLEFSMLEWYRLGAGMSALMAEVAALVRQLLGGAAPTGIEYIRYRDCLRGALGIDAHVDSDARLAECARDLGFENTLLLRLDRDQLLDLLMSTRVGPGLGRDGLCFVHHYPASQAALARLDPAEPREALRFELYIDGVELANGFEELSSASEQRSRFNADLQLRRQRGLPAVELDEYLLAALHSGLPDCSGVALGFDRLLMLAANAHHIEEVQSFPSERA
jgi:lysyl-tRNA synthetase class 2